MMRTRSALSTLALGLALYAGQAAAQGTTITLGETIVLKAEEVPLLEVLTEIGETVPLELRLRGTAVEDLVSLAIEAPDWPAVLSKLLGRESYVLRFDTATGKPVLLVVLWDKVRLARGDAAPGGPAGDIEARIRATAVELLSAPDLAGQAIARMEEARENFLSARAAIDAQAPGAEGTEALAEAYEEAREIYHSSMRDLEGHDETRSVTALLSAFDIDDRDTHLTALETLRWLSQTGRDPEAVSLATGALYTAEDEEVERAALEVLVRYGDEDELLSTLEPIALNEGPNRELAVREWIRIRDEQNARTQEQGKSGSRSKN